MGIYLFISMHCIILIILYIALAVSSRSPAAYEELKSFKILQVIVITPPLGFALHEPNLLFYKSFSISATCIHVSTCPSITQ